MRAKRRTRRTLKSRVKTYGLICLAIIAVSGLVYAFLNRPETFFNPGEKRAVIVDGLSTTNENRTFWWTAQDILKQAGYRTYYYEGGSDTVSLYRNLTAWGFQMIILRVHSAANLENGQLAIFTNEKWDDTTASTTYLTDILNDRLAKVRVEENSTSYFGITPNFIKAMDGKFENTIVIIMGCDGLSTQSMAEAFVQKGAKAYLGWDGPVAPQYVDEATTKLLGHLVLEKQTVSEAVGKTVEEMGNDPYYGGRLGHYP